eukprot:CAMPEP_0176486258 /NCGR_PEP_ID=MMETSP0200_2-20121128/5472_1 /TAXON_ID=947934 /ORGANISM="Chaetoceros sp., Strain GSL56" /LENGTH=160 /DNA_ID=CAMNT_0017882947 /DNA_START=240 /DNA_END=722 /DNA_ORIENTATION=+
MSVAHGVTTHRNALDSAETIHSQEALRIAGVIIVVIVIAFILVLFLLLLCSKARSPAGGYYDRDRYILGDGVGAAAIVATDTVNTSTNCNDLDGNDGNDHGADGDGGNVDDNVDLEDHDQGGEDDNSCLNDDDDDDSSANGQYDNMTHTHGKYNVEMMDE